MRLFSRWSPVWQNRLYIILWLSQAGSLAGDVFHNLAILVHVYNLTGSALQVGTLMVFTVLPSLAVGSFAGVVIDRWPARRTLVWADLVRALCAAGIASSQSTWQIYILTFVLNAAARFFRPTWTATIASTVPRQHLPMVNSFNATTRRLILLVLPSVAGIVVSLYGARVAFGLNALSYVFSAAILFRCSIPNPAAPQPGQAPTGFWTQWVEGLQAVAGSLPVRALTISVALLGLPVGVNNALVVVFAERELGVSVVQFGYLTSALTAGVLLGGLLFGYIPPDRRRRYLATAAGLTAAGLAFLAFAVNRTFYLALVLRAVLGCGFSLYNVAANTTLQEEVRPGLRGRVFSFYSTTDDISTLVFLSLAGAMADAVGITPLFLAAGVCVLVTAAYLYLSLCLGRSAPAAVAHGEGKA